MTTIFRLSDPGLRDLYWLQLHAVGTGSFPLATFLKSALQEVLQLTTMQYD